MTCGVIRQVTSDVPKDSADLIFHQNTRNHSPNHRTWILSSTSVRIWSYYFGRTPHIPYQASICKQAVVMGYAYRPLYEYVTRHNYVAWDLPPHRFLQSVSPLP